MGSRKKEYMKGVQLPDLRRQRETLCWDCANALNNGCSWLRPDEQKPVEGWKAKKTSRGYLVKECPCFERCSWCRGRFRTAEDYILALEESLRDKTRKAEKYRDLNRKYREMIAKLRWQLVVHMGN